MIGATLYLVGKEAENGNIVKEANSCAMCKRAIINAGIAKVIIRDTENDFRIIDVNDWIKNDDSLSDNIGY